MHDMDDVAQFIKGVRLPGSDGGYVRTRDGSYALHLVVAQAFEGSVPYVDTRDGKVVTRVGNDLYSADGKIGSVGKRCTESYRRMSADEMAAAEGRCRSTASWA